MKELDRSRRKARSRRASSQHRRSPGDSGACLAAHRDARLARCARLAASGRMRRALEGYLGLAEEMPENLEARNRAGDLLVRAGQIARALELFASIAEAYELQGFEAKTAAIRRKILRLAPSHDATRRAMAGDRVPYSRS